MQYKSYPSKLPITTSTSWIAVSTTDGETVMVQQTEVAAPQQVEAPLNSQAEINSSVHFLYQN